MDSDLLNHWLSSRQVFMDASVKKIWEEDGLLAIHKPWGMRVYLPRNDAGDRYRSPSRLPPGGGWASRSEGHGSQQWNPKIGKWTPVISLPFRTWPGELTVHDWLKEMFPNQRTYMCNRLDFATSGLMLVALNQQAAKHASALFRKREVGPNSQSRVAMCERYVLHVPAILLSTNLTTPTVIDCFQTRLHIKGFPFDTWSYLSILIIDSLHTNYTHVKSTTILLACQVHKFYQALVLGHPPVNWDGNGNRLCDRLRDVPGRFARSVAGAEGQAAETTVKVLQRGQWPKALGTFFWGVFVHTFSLNI